MSTVIDVHNLRLADDTHALGSDGDGPVVLGSTSGGVLLVFVIWHVKPDDSD